MKASPSLSKIHKNIISRYEEPVVLTPGVYFRADKKIGQITSYRSAEYFDDSRSIDDFETQLKQPFMDVITQVSDVETRATSIKRKHIEGYAVDEDYVFSMVVEKELQEEFDNLVISNFLKNFQEPKRWYGTSLVMITDCDNEIGYKLEVPDIASAKLDPFNIDKGRKMFTHEMDFVELEEKRGVWNDDSIDELIMLAEKDEDTVVSVDHIEGIMKESDIIEGGDEENKWYEVYVGVHNGNTFYLDHTELDEKRIYAFNREDRPNNKGGLGIGAIEEVLQEQIWINDIAISMQESIQLASKVGVKTNKQGLPKVLDSENGFHVELGDDEYYDPFTFDMPQVQYTMYIDAWVQNLQRKSSVFNAVTGEEQKAGTPYAGQSLQSQQASSIFDYRRERDGQDVIWIIENLILPRMVTRINKGHKLNASYSPQQRAIIDEAIVNRKLIQDVFDNPMIVITGEYEQKQTEYLMEQKKKGDRRSLYVPKGYITLEKIKQKMRWSVTSDTDDVQTKINSLVAQMSSLAPEDPARAMMMNEVMELSGQSPAQFLPQVVSGQMKSSFGKTNLQKQLDQVTPAGQS